MRQIFLNAHVYAKCKITLTWPDFIELVSFTSLKNDLKFFGSELWRKGFYLLPSF